MNRGPMAFLAGRVAYPLQERILRRPTFAYVADLERSQWLTREEIEEIQRKKLHSLLSSALAHSPWHADRIRACGLDAKLRRDELSLSDLRSLPTMTRQDARDNVERLRWPDVPGGAFKYNTGGSSGQPLIFWFGRWRQASDAAGRIRARRWWGVDVGDPECYLWGAPVELNKTDRIKTVRDRLVNQLVLNAFEMSPQRMDDYLDALYGFRPKCVYGYASSVALLAAHARARGKSLRLPGLKVVCTTGEPLFPHQRSLIEEVFGVPAANEFGSRDIGFTAHQAPGGQMLLMSESIVLEVLEADGTPTQPGRTGEAVLTALHSDAQPFVRYRTGDMLRVGGASPIGGQGLHVIDEVVGRSTDFVVRADGTVMHALAVIYVLRAVPGIAEFKFIQHTTDEVEVLVVPGQAWTDEAEQVIVNGIRARLGADVRVVVRRVEEIAAEVSGKFRYVTSRVPLPAALDEAPTSA